MTLGRMQLLAIAVAAGAVGLALVPAIATSSVTADHALWIELDLVIGAGFAGVGLFAWYRRPDNRIGALMVVTAFAWYLVVAGITDVSLLWTAGTLASNLFVATVIHLLLAFPSGRLESAVDRTLVIAAYVATTIGWVPAVLFIDPAVYLQCTDCPRNLVMVEADSGVAEAWMNGLAVIGLVVLAAVLVRLIGRWRSASEPLRRTVMPVLVPGAALMVALSIVLAVGLFDDYGDGTTETIFYGSLAAFGLVPYAFLAGLVRGRWIRGGGLGALISRLNQAPRDGGLRADLARALGDPSVELAYWWPEREQYVDTDGRGVTLPPPGSDRAVTEVERDGRRIGAIVHDPALLDDPEQVRAAGAAAAMALENERLEAELRAKVDELRTSRSRLVEVGMKQRQRLERDLHDGAQQRLVSLALSLRLAQERIGSDPVQAEHLLERSRKELDEALSELRELARGIHPAVLSDRGLAAAVEALAHRAPVPVELGELYPQRVPEQVELAAYFVVAEALTNVAKYAAADAAAVAVRRHNGQLTVEVSDDGVGGADADQGTGLRGLAARLEAIEGSLEVDSPPGGGTTVRASIPCER